MQVGDFDEFCEVVVGFAELKGKTLSTAALKLYFRAMQSWNMREFKAAAEQLLRTCEFMPTPKDFEDLRGAGQLTATEAWDLVLSGEPLTPGSREDRAARIASGAGQYGIRHADIERDLPFIQRRFMDAYAELSDLEAVREALPQIAGRNLSVALKHAVVPAVGRTPPRAESPVPALLPAPCAPKPGKSPREKVAALVALGTLSDDDIARVSGQAIDLVREVRTSREHAA